MPINEYEDLLIKKPDYGMSEEKAFSQEPMQQMEEVPQQEVANPYLDTLKEQQSLDEAMFEKARFTAQRRDSDKMAKALDVAPKLGMDAGFVYENFDKIKQEMPVQGYNPYSELVTQYPKLTTMLKDENFATVVKHQIDNLKKLEDSEKEYGVASTLARSIGQGAARVGSSLAASIPVLYDSYRVSRNKALEKVLGTKEEDFPSFLKLSKGKDIWDESSVLSQAEYLLDEKAKELGGKVFELNDDFLQQFADGDYKKSARTLIMQAANNAPNSLVAIGSVLTGQAALGFAGIGVSTMAGKARELEKRTDVSEETRLLNAGLTGGVEASTEMLGALLPFGMAMKSANQIIGKQFGKEAAKALSTEFFMTLLAAGTGGAVEEMAATLGEATVDYASVDDKAFQDIFKKTISSGVLGSVSGVGLTGPAAIAGARMRSKSLMQAQSGFNFWNALNDPTNIEFKNKLPAQQQQALENITRDGPLEMAYIDKEAFVELFQKKGENAASVAARLGISKEFSEAMESGTEIKVKTSDIASKLIGTDEHQLLSKHIKFDENGTTIAQEEAEQQRVEESTRELEAEMKAIETEAEDVSDQIAIEGKEVKKLVRAQLINAGRSTGEATNGAKLYEAFFRVAARGDKLGRGPLDLYNKYNLKMQRMDDPSAVGVDEQSLNQEAVAKKELSILGFYSQVETEIQKMDFKQIPAKDLENRIKNISGLKQEEVEWLGLNEFLASKEGKVSKEEVLEFIKTNGVQLEQIVLGETAGASAVGSLVWGEQERDDSDNSSNIDNEMEYYLSSDNEDGIKEEIAQWKADNEDETRSVDELYALGENDSRGYNRWNVNTYDKVDLKELGRYLNDRMFERAEEYVESDDYSMARYTVEEETTGYTLEGSDEYGWYNPDTNKNFDGNLEEAKIQLAQEMLSRGVIEGDAAALSLVSDLSWRSPAADKAVSKATLDRKAKALLSKEPQRFLDKSKADYSSPEEWEAQTQKEKNADALYYARREVEESYENPNDPKNKVQVSINHTMISGKLIGNNVKGWALEAKADFLEEDKQEIKVKLESKDLESAQKEAVEILIAQGAIRENKIDPKDINKPTMGQKFQQFSVNGGENYREFLLTLPQIKGDKFYYRAHWGDIANVIAHVRVTDRVDAKGRKTLFIEEVQSDWHQKGREQGYKQELPENMNFSDWLDSKGVKLSPEEMEKEFQSDNGKLITEYRTFQEKTLENVNAVTNAPFKNTDAWTSLAMKRMVRVAAEEGYDTIAWTPAKVHVKRWGTDSISWVKRPARTGLSIKVQDLLGSVEIRDSNDKVIEEFIFQGKNVVFNNRLAEEKAEKIKQAETALAKYSQDHFLVGAAEQRGGFTEEGTDIEEQARERGLLLERNGEVVTSKEELRKVVGQTLNRERNDRSLDSLTESLWKQMQEKETGAKLPRKEGMEFFYDNVIPRKVIPSLLKKLDPEAKIEVGQITTSDKDSSLDPETMDVLQFPVTDKMKLAVLNEGFSLFQNQGDPMGRIRFGKDGINIDMFKAANATTPIHESGHFFLKVIRDMVKEGAASDKLVADYKAIWSWLGAEEGAVLTVPQEEKWAKGIEAYFFEGRAPSKELEGAFKYFKKWFQFLYQKLESIGVELSPEIRGVMDRLFAVETEVSRANNNYENMFEDPSVRDALPEKLRQKYDDLQVKQKEATEKILQKSIMKSQMEKSTEIYQQQRDAIKAELLVEIEKDEFQLALKQMLEGSGPFLDGTGLDREIITRLPKQIINKTDGIPAQVMAEMFGYPTKADFIIALEKGIAKRTTGLETEVDAEMQRLYPDNIFEIEQLALEAVHNDFKYKILQLEYDYLQENARGISNNLTRQVIQRAKSSDFIRERAEALIDEKKFKELAPSIYERAERKASQEAAQAFLKKDFEAALQAKEKEILSHTMFKRAAEAKRFYENKIKDTKKFAKADKDLAKSRDLDFVNAARAILGKYGLDRREEVAVDHLKKLSQDEFAKDTYAGLTAMLEPLYLKAKDYKEVSYKDFKELMDVVDTLWELSRSSKQITINGKKLDLESVKAELIAQIGVLVKDKGKEAFIKSADKFDRYKTLFLGAKASMKRIEALVDAFDINFGGPFRTYIWEPISNAVTNYRLKKTEVFTQYKTLLEANKDRFSRDPIEAPELINNNGQTHTFNTKSHLLMAVLHTGNASNKSKLILGYKWGTKDSEGNVDTTAWDSFVNRMNKEGVLTKADYDLVQSIWDLMDSFKPLTQAAHKQMYGYYFSEITAETISTPYGEYRGGYIPAKADTHLVEDAKIREDVRAFEEANPTFAFPTTGRGATMKRNENYTVPLDLNMGQLGRHMDWALRFAYIEPSIKEVSRVVNDREFRANLKEVDSELGTAAFVPWLKRTASQQVVEPSKSGIGKALDYITGFLKRRMSSQIMFLSIPNTMLQVTGIPVALAIVKPSHLLAAHASYLSGPKKLSELILSKSKWMQSTLGSNIYETLSQIEDIVVNPTVFESIENFSRSHTYVTQSFAQNLVNTIVWWGAYNQAVNEGMTEAQSIEFADGAVRKTQGSVNAEDISEVETGTETRRSFTQFTSYFNMTFNLMASEFYKVYKGVGLKKGAGRLFYLTVFAYMLPATLEALLVRGLAGKPLPDDDDEDFIPDMADIFIGSSVKKSLGMIPFLSGTVSAAYNSIFTKEKFDDRISLSPTYSAGESIVKTLSNGVKLLKDESVSTKSGVRDGLFTLGIITGLPTGTLARPAGYLIDVSEGKANPSGPIDFTRGLITGKAGEN